MTEVTKRIYKLREELNNLIDRDNTDKQKLLDVSRELDVLIYEYYQIRR